MKYVKILEQKGLKKEDLAKQTQKKIERLEQLQETLDEFDEEDFDEEDKVKYEYIKTSISELDSEIERNIRKFDVEIYKKRVEVFSENRTKRKTGGVVKPDIQEIEVEVIPEPVPIKEEAPVVPIEKVAESKPVVADSEKVDSIRGKLANLKKELNVNTKKFDEDEEIRQQQQEPIEVEAEEVFEYEKTASVKPKKGSLSIILMTIGFGILTFGSVMYYKERR